MIFKRFSRSRSNSQSYVDSYQSPVDSKTNSGAYDDARAYGSSVPVSASSEPQPYDDRRDLPSSRQSDTAPQYMSPTGQETTVDNMYSSRQSQPIDSAYGSRGTNGYGGSDGYDSGMQQDTSMSKGQTTASSAPDLLMQAFNQALRPHIDKVDQMEAEIADLRAYIDQLEGQRSDVHAWIDKRGLRPGTS